MSQLTWGNAHAQVPARSVSGLVDGAEAGSRLLISAEMNLVMAAIDLLLGGGRARRGAGAEGTAPHGHRLGARQALPRAPGRPALDRVVRRHGRRALALEPRHAPRDGADRPGQRAHARADDGGAARTGTPRRSRCCSPTPRSPAWPTASTRATTSPIRRQAARPAVRDAVGRVEMTVRAEVAAVELPIEDVLALRPGDVLRLDSRADDGVTLSPAPCRSTRRSPAAAAAAVPSRSRRPWEGCRSDRRRGPGQAGAVTSEAVCGVLEMFAPGQITPGDVAVAGADRHPLQGIPTPAVVTMVSYVDGVTGGNLFVMTVAGARKLAAAMMGTEPDADGGAAELDELELSAVAEAMNQMMASAAGAVSAVLGTEVEIGVPETQTFASAEQAVAAYARTPHATRAAVSVCGEPCRLVQLVPNAFVVRMTRALDELGTEIAASGLRRPPPARRAPPSLAGIPVRVAAELGRARMASGRDRRPAGRRGRRAQPPGRRADRPVRERPALRDRPADGGGRRRLGRPHRADPRPERQRPCREGGGLDGPSARRG